MLTCRVVLVGLLLASPASAGTVEVLRDRWGVPHVYAGTGYDAAFGLGFAQAEDDVAAILDYVMSSRGTAATVAGARAAVEEDVRVRAFRLPQICETLYTTQSPEARDRCAGFAAGVEHYLSKHPDKKPVWFDRMTGRDVVAVAKWFQFRQSLGEASRDLAGGGRRGGDLADDPGGESNMWAVGPKRSSRGETMLLSDPHLPWAGLTKWYEFQLTIDGRWIYGAGFIGFGGVGIGFTEDVAWGSTNNGADTGDVYKEQLDPANHDRYRYDGGWRPVETEVVKAALPNGKTAERTVRRTHHGPILREDAKEHVAYTIKLAGLDTVNLGELADGYFRAGTVNDALAAHATGNEFKWHRLFADRHGHVGYTFCAATHERDDTVNWRRPVDGSTSATEWGPRLLGKKLPTIVDPPAGFIVNCNNGPFTVTPDSPLRPADYPRHLAGRAETLAPTTRAHRATQLLTAKDKLDFADMERISTDVKTLTAEPYRQAIVKAYQTLGEPKDGHAARALAILKAWDGLATAENTALPILACYVEAGGPETPAKNNVVVFSFEKGLKLMRDRWQSVEVPWGKVHVTRRGGGEWPLSGGGSANSVIPFTTLYMTGAKKFAEGAWVGDSGSSWMMLVKYHGGSVEAKTVVPWGNSPDPKSPHYADQAPLYAKRTFKPALLTRPAVEAALESRVTLTTGR
jgi:acyl-homoserine-lactone acylase